ANVTGNVIDNDEYSEIRNRPTISSMARQASHELGHKAGLFHPWQAGAPSDVNTEKYNNKYYSLSQDLIKRVKDNIMNSDENKVIPIQNTEGLYLSPGQTEKMKEIIDKEQQT